VIDAGGIDRLEQRRVRRRAGGPARAVARDVARYAKRILDGDKDGRRKLYEKLGLLKDKSVYAGRLVGNDRIRRVFGPPGGRAV
jgi:hypothetical protein